METKKTQNSDMVVAVDLGSTKIYSVVARKNMLGRIEIIGYGKSANEGVIRGVVSNIDNGVVFRGTNLWILNNYLT